MYAARDAGQAIGSSGQRALVMGIFIMSGAAGLIYEVVWARQLVLVFGNTTQAISAILTGFFGGMALGSLLGGRLADRVRRPLMAYAIAEAALAVVVLLTPHLFAALDVVYRASYDPGLERSALLPLLKSGVAIAALAPATVLLGATLPILTRYMAGHHTEMAFQFGALYAANTLGGIVGTAIAGYILIELVGLASTLLVGACLSALAGGVALFLSLSRWGRIPATPTVVPSPTVERTGASSNDLAPRRLILLVAYVSGMTSLGYQVLWTRLLSAGTDNAIYVFISILVVFLTGIAVGARLHGLGVVRRLGRVESLALSQLLVAAIVVGGVGIIGSEDIGRARFFVVLAATVIMGFALPLAAGLLGRDDRRIGGDAGLLLAVNTLGVIVGTFVVPMGLVPLIGSVHSVLLLGAANALLGTLLIVGLPPLPRRRVALIGGAGVLAIALGGPLVLPGITRFPHAAAIEQRGQLFASAEDEIAAVEAGMLDGERHLWVGGVSMTVLTVDAKLMPLLPLMARPDAESALVIAFGMGTSFRTALIAGLRTDAVELVPSVPRMFHYFHPDAAEVLANPRGRLVIADGRNYVELADEQYDLIVVDPPPPVRSAGTGVLYSQEFYEAAAARLVAGGIVMEWMPHSQSVDEFRAQMQTFMSVFDHAVFVLSPVDLGVFMLGSDAPIDLRPQAISAVLHRPGILDDLAAAPDAPAKTIDYWTQRIPDLIWTMDEEARSFAAGAPVITDDRPYTEFFLLRDTFGPPSPELLTANLIALLEQHRAR